MYRGEGKGDGIAEDESIPLAQKTPPTVLLGLAGGQGFLKFYYYEPDLIIPSGARRRRQ